MNSHSEKNLFHKYLDLLIKWNKTYNLTAITSPREIQIKHFEDSLALLSHLPPSCRLLDVGCGAGFPGIPIKIERPDIHVVLLDASRKKISFCQTVIRELQLDRVDVFQGRAENPDLIVEKFGLFDAVVTRATFSISDFLGMAKEFLISQGMVIMMKGKEWKKEKSFPSEWQLEKEVDYELREDLGKRTLLFFKNKREQY